MDGLSNVSGVKFREIKVGGKAYRGTVQTVGEVAELEAYVISLRPDPVQVFERLIQATPDAYKPLFMEKTWKLAQQPLYASSEEIQAFRMCPRGLGWAFWRAVRDNHPEVDSVETAMQILEDGSKEEIEQALRGLLALEEWADIKNFLGRMALKAASPAESVESPGEPSTSKS